MIGQTFRRQDVWCTYWRYGTFWWHETIVDVMTQCSTSDELFTLWCVFKSWRTLCCHYVFLTTWPAFCRLDIFCLIIVWTKYNENVILMLNRTFWRVLTSWQTSDVMANLLTSWHTFWRHAPFYVMTSFLTSYYVFDIMANCLTFLRHDELFDFMTNFLTSWHMFYFMKTFDLFLASWQTFWRHDGVFPIVFDLMTCFLILTFLCTFWLITYFWCHFWT